MASHLAVDQDIPLRRFATLIGLGTTHPIADNKTREGCKNIRRGEIKVRVRKGLTRLAKGLSMNNVYTLLLAPRPAGEARAPDGHLLRCRSSTIHTGIACVAAPRICPPGARAKVQTLFIDRP